MWTLPNLLTTARALAVLPLMLCIAQQWRVAALAIFVAAALTDYLDGWLARRWNQESDFGRFLDPIADKLMVAGALVMLAALEFDNDGMFALLVAVTILREVLVSGLREYLAPKGVVVHVSALAKWKTATQLLAVTLLLLMLALKPGGVDGLVPASIDAPHEAFMAVLWAGPVLLALSAILAWITAWDYLRAGLRHMAR
jgi:CDP-diacylglycerol--glycerol-3-phosphate 3-phosphatidyltransferase